jgi:hypothetical protein
MSWRFLFVTLLLALGVSAWGGVRLGDWLVEHSPPAAPKQEAGADANQPVLDANGKPYTAQPPQPRIDGTLGVPEKPAETKWDITPTSLFDTVNDPAVLISKSGVTADQARKLADASRSAQPPPGDSDANALDLSASTQPQTNNVPGPIQVAGTFASTAIVQQSQATQDAVPTQQGWQNSLRSELARCADAGFFERPSCSWNARNKYCAPNRAWGTMPECPSRPGQ